MRPIIIFTLEFPTFLGGISTYIKNLVLRMECNIIVIADSHEKTSPSNLFGSKIEVIRKKLLFPSFIWPRWGKSVFIAFVLMMKKHQKLFITTHVLSLGIVLYIFK